MTNKSYEFDPCELDGSNQEEEPVTLDTWKPKPKKTELAQSEWRKNQIGDNFNQQPGIDDLRKIQALLKKKKPDSEIMRVYGVNAETLVAIKDNRYHPVDGISLDNLVKIYNEFERLDRKIDKIRGYVLMIFSILFPKQDWKDAYKVYRKTIKEDNLKKQAEKSEKSEKSEKPKKLKKKDEVQK